MGTLKIIGSAVYYIGILVMVFGLFTLMSGLSEGVGKMMQEVKSAGEIAAGNSQCPSPPCQEMQEGEPDDYVAGVFAQVEAIVDYHISQIFDQMGLQISGDKQMDDLIYKKVRRFFAFLTGGLMLVLIGTILKMLDSVTHFFTGHGKAQREAEKIRIPSGGKPQKNWVRYYSPPRSK